MATAAVILQNLVYEEIVRPGALGEDGLGMSPLGGNLVQTGPTTASLNSQLGPIFINFIVHESIVANVNSDVLLPTSVTASSGVLVSASLSGQLGFLQLTSNVSVIEAGIIVADVNEQLGDLALTASVHTLVAARLNETLGTLTLTSNVDVIKPGEITATLDEMLGILNLFSEVRNDGIKRPCHRTPDQFPREPIRV